MQWLRDNINLRRAGMVLVGLFVFMVILVAGALINAKPSRAADKGGDGGGIAGVEIAKSNSWTGCGVGVGASLVNADVSGGGPVNIGSNGQMLDVRVLCDYQAGSFVIGGNIDYGSVFGDLHNFVDDSWAVGGRVGPLLNPNTLLFASAGWTRVNTVAGNMDGWYLGGGLETKLPNTPIYLVVEYQKRTYDVTDICGGGCSGIDASADVIRAGMNLKFSFGK